MRCNEKSFVKLSEATLLNNTYKDYDCWEELDETFQWCINYHYKVLIEMYHFRAHNDYFKPISNTRIIKTNDNTYHPESSKRYYY